MPAKKKRVTKKKTTHRTKRPVRRASARNTSKTVAMRHPIPMKYNKSRFNLVFKNLVLFTILFIIFLVLYNVTTEEIYKNLFWILALLMGFVAVAFLIVLLVFVFIRLIRKV